MALPYHLFTGAIPLSGLAAVIGTIFLWAAIDMSAFREATIAGCITFMAGVVHVVSRLGLSRLGALRVDTKHGRRTLQRLLRDLGSKSDVLATMTAIAVPYACCGNTWSTLYVELMRY